MPITATSPAADAVLLRKEGRAAYLTLNRPKAINALTRDMVLRVRAALDEWQEDASVDGVVITGTGDRGLCAGGDIRAVREAVITGRPREAAEFWRDEYRLNLAISRYPKPYVAIMDGIVMGGGVGISAHGS
ncbi:MAG TPA: enoyl-CoA hydratase/isomerase family protein, partial [Pseudonocardiaceae bacterium]